MIEAEHAGIEAMNEGVAEYSDEEIAAMAADIDNIEEIQAMIQAEIDAENRARALAVAKIVHETLMDEKFGKVDISVVSDEELQAMISKGDDSNNMEVNDD